MEPGFPVSPMAPAEEKSAKERTLEIGRKAVWPWLLWARRLLSQAPKDS